ncbi:hypothetical protein BT67DRAFT_463243 [Trichocladium antarcticum]|uniref:Uncharacterized protein n=1 Tax=Trichocladium antarcticum TaxID=1450529 RepID=A0AAN6UHH2_9PEZI|nr:hypothetical protein BT67DRAFT_463243 [Trichocladium antarcticum]
MASAAATIPRFLLPQSGLIWRRVVAATPAPPPSASASRRVFLRFASSSSSSSKPGPRILEKPERFNPPSHGARLPKKTTPRHYGGDLSADEIKVQAQTDYPMMMAPKGSRAYWFWHSRWIHVVITVGTLSGLAIWTFALSFRETSPFAHMLPAASDFLWHPLSSMAMLIEVMRLHEADKSARIHEKRQRYVDDVAKRAAYRKAHGLPDAVGFFNQPMAKPKTETDGDAAQREAESEAEAAAAAAHPLPAEERQEVIDGARKKWLGIF